MAMEPLYTAEFGRSSPIFYPIIALLKVRDVFRNTLLHLGLEPAALPHYKHSWRHRNGRYFVLMHLHCRNYTEAGRRFISDMGARLTVQMGNMFPSPSFIQA